MRPATSNNTQSPRPTPPRAPSATPQSTPATVVDALNGVFGKQDHHRAIHAKGVVVRGTFTPADAAAQVSTAPHFQTSVAVTARLSSFHGVPTTPDASPGDNPRGLAVRFHLPDGTSTDIVAHSYDGFPVKTVDEFRELFVALGASGPGTASPTPAEKFLATRPRARAFLTGQKAAPTSYATLPYYGVNAFTFLSAAGVATHGRYRFLPLAGEHLLTKAEEQSAAPDYLRVELADRLARGPAVFRLVLQLAEPSDDLTDPSVAWPDTRPTMDLGVLQVAQIAADSEIAERALVFSPASLPKGIEAADPMVRFRSDAYGESFRRRST